MKKHYTVAAVAAVAALTACAGSEATQTANPTMPPTVQAVATTASAAEAAPFLGVADTELGQILADADGRTLYGLTNDSDGSPTCVDGCSTAWPPVVVDGSLDFSTLPSSASFSIVDRPDGTKQLKAGKWPLYYFAGDSTPGDANGQGSGGMWFVVAPDATLIK